LPVAVAAASFLCFALPGSIAHAQDGGATRDAAKHFQRGVALYGETDYRAALVEFKRAYALAPNVSVLYNVGETEFQLQDYAGALTTFERYLAEASSSDAHRSEVESNVEVLRARVGHVAITTIPPGAEIAVDDQNFGRTPLEKSVLVSIGHRKIVASMPGRPSLTRYVDVAADDNLTVTLQLAAAGDLGPSSPPKAAAPSKEPEAAPGNGATLRTVGWIGTGLLGAGAITLAVLADHESSTLQRMRATYPTSAADLARESSLTSTYSLVADSLTAAAIVVGAISAYMTFTSPSTDSHVRGSASEVRVGVGPGSARFEMTF
jgi:hypothetical protein